MSLSKNKIKYIQSLKEKKFRKEHKTFVAEGDKLILDLLPYLSCQILAGSSEFIASISPKFQIEERVVTSEEELRKASFLKNPQNAIAVFYQPDYQIENIENKLSLALDGVQDPGNLGTIIRLADWYGIENVFCSLDSADIYNPKAVQATMGALCRIKVHYVELDDFLKTHASLPIYGTFLDGRDIYEQELSENGIIIMGNEGNGISLSIEPLVSHKLLLPNYPKGMPTSESLNVAIATAIVCAEFRRRSLEY